MKSLSDKESFLLLRYIVLKESRLPRYTVCRLRMSHRRETVLTQLINCMLSVSEDLPQLTVRAASHLVPPSLKVGRENIDLSSSHSSIFIKEMERNKGGVVRPSYHLVWSRTYVFSFLLFLSIIFPLPAICSLGSGSVWLDPRKLEYMAVRFTGIYG